MLNRKMSMTIVAGSVLVLAQAALAISPESAVVSDASNRLSLAGETGGYDGGHFFLGDGSKGNRITLGGYTQFRENMTIANNPAGSRDFTHGFQLRRIRVEVGGSVGDPNMEFKVSTDFTDSTGGFAELKDAWMKYNFGNGLYLRAGQYKTGMTREQLVGDQNQLLVERSITDGVFSWGRSQGVGLIGTQNDQFRWFVDFTDGPNTDNTEYDSTSEADFGVVGRGEFLVMGKNWDASNQYSSWTSTSDNTGIVGVAIGYAHGGDTGTGNTGTPTTRGNVIQLSADTQWSGDGWNGFAAGHFRNTDDGTTSFQDFGFVLQGGYFFQENLEGFARLDSTVPDNNTTGGNNSFTTLGAGINYYLIPNSQASKVTAQINYYHDASANNALISTGSNANLLASAEKGQVGFVFQWQGVW